MSGVERGETYNLLCGAGLSSRTRDGVDVVGPEVRLRDEWRERVSIAILSRTLDAAGVGVRGSGAIAVDIV